MKFRHEYKHAINLADRLVLRTRLAAVMERDEHAEADGRRKGPCSASFVVNKLFTQFKKSTPAHRAVF